MHSSALHLPAEIETLYSQFQELYDSKKDKKPISKNKLLQFQNKLVNLLDDGEQLQILFSKESDDYINLDAKRNSLRRLLIMLKTVSFPKLDSDELESLFESYGRNLLVDGSVQELLTTEMLNDLLQEDSILQKIENRYLFLDIILNRLSASDFVDERNNINLIVLFIKKIIQLSNNKDKKSDISQNKFESHIPDIIYVVLCVAENNPVRAVKITSALINEGVYAVNLHTLDFFIRIAKINFLFSLELAKIEKFRELITTRADFLRLAVINNTLAEELLNDKRIAELVGSPKKLAFDVLSERYQLRNQQIKKLFFKKRNVEVLDLANAPLPQQRKKIDDQVRNADAQIKKSFLSVKSYIEQMMYGESGYYTR